MFPPHNKKKFFSFKVEKMQQKRSKKMKISSIFSLHLKVFTSPKKCHNLHVFSLLNIFFLPRLTFFLLFFPSHSQFHFYLHFLLKLWWDFSILDKSHKNHRFDNKEDDVDVKRKRMFWIRQRAIIIVELNPRTGHFQFLPPKIMKKSGLD